MLLKVMIMIKTSARFASSLILCLLLVYAPEILTVVSAPYSLRSPDRTLLRIALCCEDTSLSSSIFEAIRTYQKSHPSVHLRIVRISEEQLPFLHAPYPDVLLFPPWVQNDIPLNISFKTSALTYAVHCDSPETDAAAHFAAYLYEASPPQDRASDF